ncbi:MAG: hypothetical protein ACJ76F_04490 [Bacteroidia bacterium]
MTFLLIDSAFAHRMILILLLFIYFPGAVYTQSTYDLLNSKSPDQETKALFDKYLESTDNAEIKIRELLDLAYGSNASEGFSGQVKKMQIALVLENYVSRPCKATFDLNSRMGEIFREINVSYAIRYYEKAISISLRSSEPTDRFVVYNILAGLYLKLNDHRNVLLCYANAMREAKVYGKVSLSSVNNNIGWFYARTGNKDSAMFYFKKALSYYDPTTTDDDLYSNILENIAKQQELEGKYTDALKIYHFNEDFYRRHDHVGDLIENRINIVRVMAKLKDSGLRDSIVSLTRLIDKSTDFVDEQAALRFFKFSYSYFNGRNDNKTAHIYYDKYDKLKDLIAKKNVDKANALTNLLLRAQSLGFKSEYEVYQVELLATKTASYKNKVIAMLFLITGLLIIIALVIFIHKRKKELLILKKIAAAELKTKELEGRSIKTELENVRLQAEMEIRRKEAEAQQIQNELERERILVRAELESRDLEKKTIQNELELKQKDLTSIVLFNTQVYENNKEMIGRLQEISGEPDIQRSLKTFLLDLKSRNQVEERLSSLQKNIDQLNTEFYDKLKIRFPQLSRAEAELCGYILINLSNKDISILKNVEPASVKMGKTRLRKKLGLEPEKDLLDFIRMI